MAKVKTVFLCTECGYESAGWLGKCPGCGGWNTLVEERSTSSAASTGKSGNGGGTRGWLPVDAAAASGQKSGAVDLMDVAAGSEQRFATGIREMDRVLGGGFVRGSLVLVGGDPGIGKSTLLLQVCDRGAFEGKVLYVSGEESPQQVRLRAERLGAMSGRIRLLAETSFEAVARAIDAERPVLAVVDSIQTMYSDDLNSAPGSVGQVREVTAGLLRVAKSLGTTIVLVGHVTKDGAIAGPRVLEHMVDTVLYFEGDRHGTYRILRAVKNRFGATDELGIFEMRDTGLEEVDNASQAMLSGRATDVPGSVVTACMEGTRPLLVEIQALLSPSVYPSPRRMAQGFDAGRVTMLMAVLEKKTPIGLGNMDAYVNVVGGLQIDEPASDLAVVAAVAGSFRNRAVRAGTVLFGEVGLTGEIRPVAHPERRVIESARLGFTCCILPGACRRSMERSSTPDGIDLIYVDTVGEALDVCL
jgi:DNA repair protein RadA/Sms